MFFNSFFLNFQKIYKILHVKIITNNFRGKNVKMSDITIQSCIESLSNDIVEYYAHLFEMESKIMDFKLKHPFFVFFDESNFFKNFFN